MLFRRSVSAVSAIFLFVPLVFSSLAKSQAVFGAPTAAPARAKHTAGKKTFVKPDPAVEKVLRAEVAGPVNRREQLADALSQRPDSASARWQAGFVKVADSWRSFDELPTAKDQSDPLEQYRRHRNEAPLTLAAQLNLANWCRKEALFDRERVHLTAALSLAADSDRPELLKRLGYMLFGGQWISEEQRHEWEGEIIRTESSLKKWSTKLERIAQRLAGNTAQHDTALADLRAISDPAAIPAMELVLSGRDEETAQLVVERFKHFEGPQASLALAKQAVFSMWPAVREAATRTLKSRKFEDFVPAMIALLATPIETGFQVLLDPSSGVLLYSFVMATEMENQFQVGALNVARPILFVRTGSTNGPPRIDVKALTSGPIRRANTDFSRSLSELNHAQERGREAANDRIKEMNDRVTTVLTEIAEMEGTPDVRHWWQWWYDFTDAPPAGAKAVNIVTETEFAAPFVIPYLRHSCFAAGTPVWTETGPVPIETIKPGDRVLAQEIGSGELAYKSVLLTTENPPRELLTFRASDESIVCTKGHRFWSCEGGWTKARDLVPQTLLHTVTGSAPVWSVKPAPAAKTFNLVIDGWHTYFVGKSAILCQDLRSSSGPDVLVPGLHRGNAARAAD